MCVSQCTGGSEWSKIRAFHIGALPSQVKDKSGPALPGATTSAMYSAYADDVFVCVEQSQD